MAGIPFRQEYSYNADDDDEDGNYFCITRTGDAFSIDTDFRDGWTTDVMPIFNLFQRLKDDMRRLCWAIQEYSKMMRDFGAVEIKCTQSGAIFECNEYKVTLEKRYDGRKGVAVFASVKNTLTGKTTEHKVGDSLTAEAANTAIRLHIAENLELKQ